MSGLILSCLYWLNQNQGLAQWILAAVALVALIYTIREFFLKQRPYIDLEIQVAENGQTDQAGWLFFALLVNKGTYPATVKVQNTIMRVGDEEYPSEVKNFVFISPGESKKMALIGSINNIGIEKIRQKQYKNNYAEIYAKVKSAKIGSKKLNYLTEVTYRVDVSGDKPLITLIEERYT